MRTLPRSILRTAVMVCPLPPVRKPAPVASRKHGNERGVGHQQFPTTQQNSLTLASSRPLGAGSLRPQVDAGPRVRAQVSRARLVEWQFLCNRGEQLPYIRRGLGGGLKEEQAGLAGIGLGIGRRDRTLVRLLRGEIQLVARQSDDNVLVRLTLEFLHPRLGLVQR